MALLLHVTISSGQIAAQQDRQVILYWKPKSRFEENLYNMPETIG